MAVVVAVFVCTCASTARAADPAEVEDLIRQGIALRRSGHDHRAFPLFQKAYDLSPSPRTSAQLGLVELALGYFMDAERHLTDGLASPRDPWIQKTRETLEGALEMARAGIGEVVVTGSPAGADLFLNGKKVGQLGQPAPVIRVGEGPAKISVRAPGFQTKDVPIRVTGGAKQALTIALDPEPAAVVQLPPPRAEAVPPVVAHVAPPVSPPSPADERPAATGTLKIAGIASAAVGAAALGLGVFSSVKVRSVQKNLDELRGLPGSADGESIAEKVDSGNRFRTLQWIGYGVGAVGLGASAVCLWMAYSSPATGGHAVAMAPMLSPAATGGTVTIRF